MSSLSKIRQETAERMADAPAEQLTCRYCGAATKRETLSALGARCQPCYDQFLRLGYSGSQPPKQHAQAAWVKAEQAKVRHIPNQFGALAERLKAARPQPIRGLSEDEVNALAQLEGGQ